MFKRIAFFVYGSLSYVIFLATFLYAIGFIGNFGVPRTLDGAPSKPLWVALLIDAGLLTLFAVQHSVMARKWFKDWWTRMVPKPLERSTYVLFSSLALILLFWQWQPLGGVVWSIEDPVGRIVLHVLFAFGWALVLVSTFLISHFELFGLRQVWARLRGQELPSPVFRTPSLYKRVRHPIYLGFLLAFWAAPTMSVGHLLFAVATTGYILIGIFLEERDLMALFGEQYRRYREEVPMLIPLFKALEQRRREGRLL
jgi:protein-S-isoprenylcysteine O-methyltransferase Ste14